MLPNYAYVPFYSVPIETNLVKNVLLGLESNFVGRGGHNKPVDALHIKVLPGSDSSNPSNSLSTLRSLNGFVINVHMGGSSFQFTQ